MTKQGIIYFVGTGPGDAGLITVKGLALIREAEAILADTLGHATLLQEASSEAELHDTGSRRRGNKQPSQAVTRLMLRLAKQGKTVVRLWRGDPFVFGRAAQEMDEAIKAGLRVAVVPGITSAIAVLAYAGVPVTHWDYATSFTVVSGYVHAGSPVQPDWPALARSETLVILIPTENLSQIVAELLAAGRAPDTPAMIVQNGTLPSQKRVLTTLEELVQAAAAHDIQSPAIVTVGHIVNLAQQLDWFRPGLENPLVGKRVLVTRPTHQAADFMAELRALGAEPISFPTIEILPLENNQPLQTAILRLAGRVAPDAGSSPASAPYDWLVLTSANGVAAFWDELDNLGLDSRCLASLKIAAIGPATAAALNRRSVKPDLIPEVYTAEGVLDAFDKLGSVAGQRFLLARADIARKALAEGLIERGAQVDEYPAYRTVPRQAGKLPPPADIVTFTSSSTVQGYVNCLAGRSPTEALQHSDVVCIGPITAKTANELGVPVTAVAQDYTIDGILDTLKHGTRE